MWGVETGVGSGEGNDGESQVEEGKGRGMEGGVQRHKRFRDDE